MPGRSWRTRANAITASRLALTPLLWAAISGGRPLLASAVFFLAVASDFADGWVARRYGEESPHGGVLDHAVDAVFVSCGAAALAIEGVLPAPLPPLIAAAFLQYVADSRAIRSQGLRPSVLGRWNGIAYYVIVAVPIVRDALALGWPGAGLVSILGRALVISTVLSMLDRLRWLLRARRARDPAV